jgi:hypothetical protein
MVGPRPIHYLPIDHHATEHGGIAPEFSGRPRGHQLRWQGSAEVSPFSWIHQTKNGGFPSAVSAARSWFPDSLSIGRGPAHGSLTGGGKAMTEDSIRSSDVRVREPPNRAGLSTNRA